MIRIKSSGMLGDGVWFFRAQQLVYGIVLTSAGDFFTLKQKKASNERGDSKGKSEPLGSFHG